MQKAVWLVCKRFGLPRDMRLFISKQATRQARAIDLESHRAIARLLHPGIPLLFLSCTISSAIHHHVQEWSPKYALYPDLCLKPVIVYWQYRYWQWFWANNENAAISV